MKQSPSLSLFLVLILALVGCVPEREARPPSPILSPAATSISTDMASPAPTATDSLLTATSSLTVTPTLVDTLEPLNVTQTLQPLFQEPMNCAVPCFWGMIPGKTRMDEAKTFFGRLGFRSREEKGFYSTGYKSDRGDGFSLTLYASSPIVENIIITPDIVIQKEGGPRAWMAYSPETLIKRYGKPSRVEFWLEWGPNFVIDMTMYFDDLDLMVDYSGYNMIPGHPHSPKVCPLTLPFDYVRLWMGPNPPDPPLEGVALENATMLTIDKFTELMLGNPKTACFVVNGDVFP